MADIRSSNQRFFNLDSLERNSWRNRINQLKRELREANKPGTSSSRRSPRRRGGRSSSMRSTG